MGGDTDGQHGVSAEGRTQHTLTDARTERNGRDPMPNPSDFSYVTRADGTIVITHRRRKAATLRGERAAKFAEEVESGDAQEVMARWTGAYKFGNERTARNHPRNQGRRA